MADQSVAQSTSRRLAHLIETCPDAFRGDFVVHAAPEAVSAHITQYRKRARAIEDTLKWLRELQAARATQVHKEWPPSPSKASTPQLVDLEGALKRSCGVKS